MLPGSQIEHQRGWAQDLGKSESVWRVTEVMARRRAESFGESSGFLTATSSWFSGKESYHQWTEAWGDKDQGGGHCKNKCFEHLWQTCIRMGVPKLCEDLKAFDPIDIVDLYIFVFIIVIVVLLLACCHLESTDYFYISFERIEE